MHGQFAREGDMSSSTQSSRSHRKYLEKYTLTLTYENDIRIYPFLLQVKGISVSALTPHGCMQCMRIALINELRSDIRD